MDDRSAVIAEFCAITGAAPHIAENYLGAHEWDIGRASDFFFEHPPDNLDEQHAPNHAAHGGEGLGAAGGGGRFVACHMLGPPAWTYRTYPPSASASHTALNTLLLTVGIGVIAAPPGHLPDLIEVSNAR